MCRNPIPSKRLQPGAWAVPQSEINHLADRSRGLFSHATRVTAAQPLRYCRITAHHQKSRTLQSKQRRKKEKNEQPEELEAFTINYLQLFFFIFFF